jgi:serine/threonine protein kinase
MRSEPPGLRGAAQHAPPTASAKVDPAEITAPTRTAVEASPGALAELAVHFELLGELGRGASAVVYHARDRRLGREVALKIVRTPPGVAHGDTEALARLSREASTMAQLDHPNIVRLHAVHPLRNGLALEMPRVAGRTLKQLVVEDGALPPARAVAILRDVASALAYAHRRGVVHRDVKPANIFVDETTGRALLADFGVARLDDVDTRLTQTGVTVGTPAYMSPEQIDGLALDGRADIYSLGLVGWELLTGRRPWEGEALLSVLQRQQHDALPPIETVRPDDLPPVPRALEYVIERMMEKRAEARWPDADAVVAQLAKPTLPRDFGRWRRQHARRVTLARREQAAVRARARARLAAALPGLQLPSADDDTHAPLIAASDSAVALPERTPPRPRPSWIEQLPPLPVRPMRLALLVAASSALVVLLVSFDGVPLGELAPARVYGRVRGLGQSSESALDEAATRLGGGRTAGATGGAPVALPSLAPGALDAPGFVGSTRDALSRVAARLRGAGRAEPPPVVAAGVPAIAGAPDSAPSLAQRSAEIAGAWHHGDARSRLGDSLTLVLRGDGTARETIRRLSLDPRDGWRVARVRRDGLWELRADALARVELCITWHTPEPPSTSCAPAVVDVAADGRRLTYAGRHWRSQPAQADDAP